MQKKGQSFEVMRKNAHLRLRTNTFGAVMRIRHNMAIAIHDYFHKHGFFYFHSPIITGSDCEGAGQMFQVTTKNLYDLKKDEHGIGGHLYLRSHFPCRKLQHAEAPG